MDKVSMILSALLTMTLLVFIAPNIFAIQRGKALRNIALWMAILLGLALFYKHFGPGSTNPLFDTPDSMKRLEQGNSDAPPSDPPQDIILDGNKKDDKPSDSAPSFTPPAE